MDHYTTDTDQMVAKYTKQLLREHGITQDQVREILSSEGTIRSSSYVNDRLNARRSFALSELDRIAQAVGMKDALDLVAAAKYGSRPTEDVRESLYILLGALARREAQSGKLEQMID